jgi:hypothetical protein
MGYILTRLQSSVMTFCGLDNFTEVSEKLSASVFKAVREEKGYLDCSKNGGNKLSQNVSNKLPMETTPYSR